MPSKAKDSPRGSLSEPRLDGYRLPSTVDPGSLPRNHPHVSVPDWHFEDVTFDVPVSVAKLALFKEINRLKLKLESGKDSRPVFNGNGNPYLADVANGQAHMAAMAHAEAESAKAQLERLESLVSASDAEIAAWAVGNGKVGRHVSGGWIVL